MSARLSAIDPVDHETFLGAAQDRITGRFGDGVFPRHLHQQMRMFNVHDDVLGVVDLLFHRNAEIALEHGRDSLRQRTALDQLARISHFQYRRAGERLEPRPLRQTNPGAEANFTAFQRAVRSKASAVRPNTSPSLTARVM